MSGVTGFLKIMKKYLQGVYNNPLFSGSVIMVAGNMVANVVNYVYHILMGRMLGPVDYGILASIYSILYLVSIIPASTSVAIVKFIATAPDQAETYSVYKTIEKFVLKFALIVSSIIFVFSPVISNFLNINNYFSVALVSPVLFFSLITLVNQSASQGLTKFMGNVAPNVISSIVKLILGVAFVYIGWSVLGAMIGVVFALIAAYLYSYSFINKHLKKYRFREIDLKPFFKYALPVLIQALAFTSIFTTDVILVKHFFPAFEAGVYAAMSTLGKIIFFATAPVAATMFPIVSKKHAKSEPFLNVFLISFFVTFVVSFFVVTLYWLFPNIAIGTLYGSAYLSASSNLVWMGLFLAFYSMSSLLVNFFLAIGKVWVVAIPFVLAILQVLLIWIRHSSILDVLQSSLAVSFVIFVFLLIYMFIIQNRGFE